MSNGIGRKISIGIGGESAWGTPVASPTFYLPVTDYSVEEVVVQAENVANLGSTYAVNDVVNAFSYANFSLTFKMDENSLPLLLKQFCTVSSTTASGETVVYQHTCDFNSTNAGTSYTLFINDPDRSDNKQYISGARYDTLNISAENNGFVMVEVSGRGKYPVTTTSGVTVESPREFVGKNASFKYATYSGTLATTSILTMNLTHSFGLTDDADNVTLGSDGLTQLYNLASRFEGEFSTLYADNTIRDDWKNGIEKQHQALFVDAGRYIAGSVASTNPSVTFTYPRSKIIEWSRDGASDDLLKQNFKLLALDKVGVASTPIQIVVKNSIASY